MTLSNNTWRKAPVSETLGIVGPYIEQLPVIAQNDITYSPNIQCHTFEVRKEYSVSGYPNLGKGYTRDEALLSGLMEAIEMSFIEGLVPLAWYSDKLQDSIEREDRDSSCPTSTLFGEERDISLQDILFFKDKPRDFGSKSRTNGLASGRSLEEAIVHATHELIERHVIGCTERYRLDPDCLTNDLMGFLKCLEDNQLDCSIYTFPSYAKTVTVEFHMVVREHGSFDSYAGIGFGCSGEIDVAVCRAISEAFQSVSVAKAISMSKYGIGSERTGAHYGYLESFNRHLDNSRKLVEYIERTRVCCNKFASDSMLKTSNSYTVDDLSNYLSLEGVKSLGYILLSDLHLPFVAVRCFADGLENHYSF
jgi:YcaO-like protein with predicted kinase domain